MTRREMARAAARLVAEAAAAPGAAYLTGQAIAVDGGLSTLR